MASYVGLAPGALFLQYEGMNPSGSFKDNGMTAAFTHARMVGARRAACASTGNTSASMAVYCAVTRLMKGIIFIGSGKISYGKLSQALDYGALTVQIAGDFDDAMARVQEVSRDLGLYLVNSVNPFRLEGQKTIMFRVLEALRWEVPDWIVVPGGNLGNSSAFGKAFIELRELGQQTKFLIQDLEAFLRDVIRFHVVNADLKVIEPGAVQSLYALGGEQVAVGDQRRDNVGASYPLDHRFQFWMKQRLAAAEGDGQRS